MGVVIEFGTVGGGMIQILTEIVLFMELGMKIYQQVNYVLIPQAMKHKS